MTQSSSNSNRRTALSGGDEQTIEIAAVGTANGSAGPLAANGAPPTLPDTVDPLTRQLRQMYGAIAEEPIPDAIAALLERLKG